MNEWIESIQVGFGPGPGSQEVTSATQLRVKRLHPDARVPRYATGGAACFDLHALRRDTVQLGQPVTFRTGLAFEVPHGYVLLVFSRSGHGFNNHVRLANCVGVIDSDYRGELMVKLTPDQGGALYVNEGDRIAQAMLVPVPTVQLVEVDELSETARGTGGLGSTGA